MYLDLMSINVDVINELPAQNDNFDSDIDGLENNNHNTKRSVHKRGSWNELETP